MKHTLTILLSLIVFNSVMAQTDFELIIDRSYYSEDCIQGYLFVEDQSIGYTLELPWKDNQNNVSSIPTGTYSGILRYDHQDKWRIELLDVPNRTNIQIHIGNYTSDIEGCILIGSSVKDCSIFSSRKAYEKLKIMFYGSKNPNNSPNKAITITIKT